MSYREALAAINLEMPDSIPHYESIANPGFERAVTGRDPFRQRLQSGLDLLEKLNISMVNPFGLYRLLGEPPQETGGDDGGTPDRDVVWGSGRTWRWDHGVGFDSLDDVWSFDPVRHVYEADPGLFQDLGEIKPLLGLSDRHMVASLQEAYRRKQDIIGERALIPLAYYRTLVMWPIMLFGWDLFLEAVASQPERLARVLNAFAGISRRVFRAYAQVDAPVVMSHDDLCMTAGCICDPKWYRRYVFPLYEEFWCLLKDAGKKVIFISDGKVDDIVDDVFACGADGIMVEPYTDLAAIARRYGDRKIIIGNIDSRILTFGGRSDVRAEVERCARLGRGCPGYFFCVSNSVPQNVPVESAMYYFECCRELGRRS